MLVADLAQLDEVGLQAVHLLVGLTVVRGLLLQVLLQTHLAVVDLPQAGLELLVVHRDVLHLFVAAVVRHVVDAAALLRAALLLEDLDGFVEGLDGRPLHLDLLGEAAAGG